MSEDYAGGRNVAAEIMAPFIAKGGKIIKEIYAPLTVTDYSGLSLWSTLGCVYRGKNHFRIASNEGGKVALWISSVDLQWPCNVRFSPDNNRIAPLQ